MVTQIDDPVIPPDIQACRLQLQGLGLVAAQIVKARGSNAFAAQVFQCLNITAPGSGNDHTANAAGSDAVPVALQGSQYAGQAALAADHQEMGRIGQEIG